jgi:hypothetical protein
MIILNIGTSVTESIWQLFTHSMAANAILLVSLFFNLEMTFKISKCSLYLAGVVSEQTGEVQETREPDAER